MEGERKRKCRMTVKSQNLPVLEAHFVSVTPYNPERYSLYRERIFFYYPNCDELLASLVLFLHTNLVLLLISLASNNMK